MRARAVFQIPLPYYIYGRYAKAQISHRRSRRATPKVEGEGRRWGIGAVSEAADALLFAGADEVDPILASSFYHAYSNLYYEKLNI